MKFNVILKIPVIAVDRDDAISSVCNTLDEYFLTKNPVRRGELAEWIKREVTIEIAG